MSSPPRGDVDVFLHQNQKRHFNRGDYVIPPGHFTICML